MNMPAEPIHVPQPRWRLLEPHPTSPDLDTLAVAKLGCRRRRRHGSEHHRRERERERERERGGLCHTMHGSDAASRHTTAPKERAKPPRAMPKEEANPRTVKAWIWSMKSATVFGLDPVGEECRGCRGGCGGRRGAHGSSRRRGSNGRSYATVAAPCLRCPSWCVPKSERERECRARRGRGRGDTLSEMKSVLRATRDFAKGGGAREEAATSWERA